jgi:hypothetical protein
LRDCDEAMEIWFPIVESDYWEIFL